MNALRIAAALGIILLAAGCGSKHAASKPSTAPSARHAAAPPRPSAPVGLRVRRTLSLPAAREGMAATSYAGSMFVSGGISSAGVSTDTVFRVDAGGSARVAATLPGPIHDAAAAPVAGRLLVFGGGQSEGSNRIFQVMPGSPRLVGSLPQALSDLDAATIGDTAYVAGGWNGTATNPDIYEAQGRGAITRVGTLPLGVRYPAVAALDGRLVVAGGETTGGTPTTTVSMFDPATRRTTRLPALPVPTDHAAAAVLNGRLYLIGGLHNGVFTDAIMAWAPGQRAWRSAGRLPAPVADAAAAPLGPGIAVLGGRGSAGTVASGVLLAP